MQTSVNRGLLGVLSIMLKVWSVCYAKKCCEYTLEDSDGLCAGTVSKRITGITGHLCINHISEWYRVCL